MCQSFSLMAGSCFRDWEVKSSGHFTIRLGLSTIFLKLSLLWWHKATRMYILICKRVLQNVTVILFTNLGGEFAMNLCHSWYYYQICNAETNKVNVCLMSWPYMFTQWGNATPRGGVFNLGEIVVFTQPRLSPFSLHSTHLSHWWRKLQIEKKSCKLQCWEWVVHQVCQLRNTSCQDFYE